MFKTFIRAAVGGLFLTLAVSVSAAFAYEVPRQDSKTKYFYIWGPEGNPLHGKGSDVFNLYVDVSEKETEPVVIKVYDADTGGKHDAGPQPYNTSMEFSVSGTAVIDKQIFGPDSADAEVFKFGPYQKEQGKKIGDKYRFTLTVKALSGDDLNLFNVRLSPNSVEVFAEEVPFALLPRFGDRMYFYPQIPAGIKTLIVGNYDLDQDGGVSSLRDHASRETYDIQDSESGQWIETRVNLASGDSRRLEYRVTTMHQDKGKAAIRFHDEKGNAMPVYFKKGQEPVKSKPAPVVKEAPVKKAEPAVSPCNRFVFDATQSYDEGKGKLDYLWDFGDGNTSDQGVVNHVYAKGGTYKVTLSVTNNSGLECDTAVTTQQVDVNTPPQAGFAGPELSCVGKEVVFDASATKDDQPANLTYHWSFSDGTQAEGKTVKKIFEKGGVYHAVLTVDDNAGTVCSQDSFRQDIRINTPPVADAGKDVTLNLTNPNDSYRVSFDGSRSFDADKDNLTYSWEFGDGERAEGARVEHVYEKSGNYTARLLVNDNSGAGCDIASSTVKVNLNRAPVADAGSPQQICQGEKVAFDASNSYGEEGQNLTYHWDLGDGNTATGMKVEHTYAKGGQYRVNLTVDDGKNTPVSSAADSTSVFVNSRPNAVLSSVKKACLSESLTFDASQSSDPDGDSLKYFWDFGDGTVLEGKSKANYQYKKGGTYRVTVSVDDGKGGSCSRASDTATVKINTPPVANAGPNLTCCQEQVSMFDGTASSDADGDSLAYNWTFGDGATAQEAKTQHAYSESGLYNVVLTVDDGSGTVCSQSSSSFTARVSGKPVPVIQVRQK